MFFCNQEVPFLHTCSRRCIITDNSLVVYVSECWLCCDNVDGLFTSYRLSLSLIVLSSHVVQYETLNSSYLNQPCFDLCEEI